ncbi:uncharacterized protein LOC125218641 isoform X2 [Salvia hispanica]|uniref:uncharacterized protein LOC125218641 isoform X1 n=1 Tax=Salvia hispanica TaxID=49212 RepID=UPI00200987E6|nr:uncharacterized protein LOC125218641 isoform X1 [Salvia hispanica]XP_047976316.1 uncharacterized protein LOC125218641 isoform X2 [Salvia hispanica]
MKKRPKSKNDVKQAHLSSTTTTTMTETDPPKKQVRRRLQTRKPYQENLLNMAEARREIVAALKLHRASMKHQQAQARICDFAPKQNPPYECCSYPAPPPPMGDFEGLDFALPRQALGLNLNLHDLITAPCSVYSPPPPPPPQLLEKPDGFEFLEIGGEEEREEEVVEFPAWLIANESCLELHHLHHPDFLQASVLPCMEIEEIEGMDGDWLA